MLSTRTNVKFKTLFRVNLSYPALVIVEFIDQSDRMKLWKRELWNMIIRFEEENVVIQVDAKKTSLSESAARPRFSSPPTAGGGGGGGGWWGGPEKVKAVR